MLEKKKHKKENKTLKTAEGHAHDGPDAVPRHPEGPPAAASCQSATYVYMYVYIHVYIYIYIMIVYIYIYMYKQLNKLDVYIYI